MNKSIALIIFTFLLSLCIEAQKIEKCNAKKSPDVPKYKIARWERNTTANPSTLLIFVGLKVKTINEKDLLALAKHLEKEFCRETQADFWIFRDYKFAQSHFDDTGKFWEGAIISSIAGYNFDRNANENYLAYNLDGGYGVNGYKIKTINIDGLTLKKP